MRSRWGLHATRCDPDAANRGRHPTVELCYSSYGTGADGRRTSRRRFGILRAAIKSKGYLYVEQSGSDGRRRGIYSVRRVQRRNVSAGARRRYEQCIRRRARRGSRCGGRRRGRRQHRSGHRRRCRRRCRRSGYLEPQRANGRDRWRRVGWRCRYSSRQCHGWAHGWLGRRRRGWRRRCGTRREYLPLERVCERFPLWRPKRQASSQVSSPGLIPALG